MVRTGANAYVKYGYETTYGAGAGTPTLSFGLKTAVTGWTLTTNRTALAALGQVEPTTFAYGQQSGTLGIGFVLGDTTSFDIFQAIYGLPTISGTDSIFGGLTAGDAAKEMNPNLTQTPRNDGLTFTTEIGFDLETGNVDVRTLKGCVLNTLSIAAAVNDTVNCTADITYGAEDAPSAAFGTAVAETSKPFTFAHGTLSLRTADGAEAIAELQEADVNFTQNSDLLYQLGSNQAVKGIKRILEITGRFRASWKDQNKVNILINQMRTGVGGSTFKETWGDAYTGGESGAAEFNLTFDNNDGKSIVIILSGLSFMDHAVTGLEPVEPVFEELNWQAKQCQITADVT